MPDENKDGEGMTIYLSALPLPDPKTGSAVLFCKLHKDQDEKRGEEENGE